MNCELRVIEGQAAGYRKLVNKPERILLGRDPSCDLCLPDPLLSRQHCLLEFGASEVKLLDLGSRNGTFVNGQKIQEGQIQPSDKIKVGKHVLEIVAIAEVQEAAPTKEASGLCSQCGLPVFADDIKHSKALRHTGRYYCEACVSKGIDQSALTKNTQRMSSMKKTMSEPIAFDMIAGANSPIVKPLPQNRELAAPAKNAMPKKIGQYEVLEVLGEGGMGRVYKARHAFLDTVVAIKAIKEEMAVHADILKRFLQEAKLGISLDHPHIIRIHDAGEYEGIYYISMEFFEGKDVYAIVKKNGPLPFDRAMTVAVQTADALDYAHKQGVIHRDVKPSNIMINSAMDLCKLTDFGLAKAWQASGAKNLTASGQTLGTIQYISPEQLEDSRKVDPQTDIFSLGASIYFTLAGVPPFGEEPIGKVIQNILNNDPPSIPNIPGQLDAVLRKSLAKKRNERFATMEKFKAALQQFVKP